MCIYIYDLYSYFLFGGSKTCHVKTPSQARREARFWVKLEEIHHESLVFSPCNHVKWGYNWYIAIDIYIYI